MYGAESVIQTFRNYNNFTIIFPLFLATVILLLMRGGEVQKKRISLFAFLAVLIIFNDISWKIIGKLTDVATYYRFIWILPILAVIAYVLTEAWFEVEKKRYRGVILALLLFIITLEDISYITRDSLRLPESADKIDHAVQEVCKLIEENKEMEQPRVAFDVYMHQRVRSYDPSILWGIGRPAYLYILNNGYGQNTGKYETEETIIQAVNDGIQDNPMELEKALEKRKIDYLVIRTDFGMDEYLAAIGWGVKDRRNEYSLYAKNV